MGGNRESDWRYMGTEGEREREREKEGGVGLSTLSQIIQRGSSQLSC